MSDSTLPPTGEPRRSLRELITLARERLGPAAARLKTREELEAALFAPPDATPPAVPTPPPSAPLEVVVRDFFVGKR